MPDERTDPTTNPPAEEAPPLAEGQRLFRQFVLKRFLGRGPLGSAWLAHHEGMGRDLAMRFLPPEWLHDERITGALREGVVRLLEFTHTNLVRVFDFQRDERNAAIITEFVDGDALQDLRVQLPQRCFEVDAIRPWVAQLCEALDYTHRYHDAVHGDLTPANLLITRRGELKMADFGLVRSLYEVLDHEDSGMSAGTLAYLSPERARGLPSHVADDVYGFGATLYDLLTSRPPFFRGNIVLQLERAVPPSMAQRRAEFEISGEPIPPEWEEVVAACLAKRPEDRPQSIEEIGVRLGLMERHTPRPPQIPAPPPLLIAPPVEYPTSFETVGAPIVATEDLTIRAAPPAPPPKLHGAGDTIFGRYTLQHEIGRGTASVVWLATDTAERRSVALKMLPDTLTNDREAMDDLAMEARRARALQHPSIVRLFDFAHGPEGAAIVMEYVNGESLAKLQRRHESACFQIREVDAWVRQLASALGHAHAAGLVHRDVQPANLLINDAGELQLTGFGTARALCDSMTRVSMSSTGATLAYLSPEQALGEPPAASDDIYAFGATVYELLTGRPPFFGGNLLHQLGASVPPSMSERRKELGADGAPIPPAWEETITACLAKRAQDRPPSMNDIADQLAASAAPATPSAPPAEAGELRAAIRKMIAPDAPAAAADAVLAPDELRTVIRTMTGTPGAAASAQTVLGADDLRAAIRKMINPAPAAASGSAAPARGVLGPDELRGVIRKMIFHGEPAEAQAAHVWLQPDELRAVIHKMISAGAPAEAAPVEPGLPPEGLRTIIRKMIATGAEEAAATATGALGPDELRSIVRKMIGVPAAAMPAAATVLAPEELRAVVRKIVGVAPAAASPAALGPEELRAVIRKMIPDAAPPAAKTPPQQALGAGELRAIIGKMVSAGAPAPEIAAAPAKAAAAEVVEEPTMRSAPAAAARKLPEPTPSSLEKTMPSQKSPPTEPVRPLAKPAPEPVPSSLEKTLPPREPAPAAPPAAVPPPAPVAAPKPPPIPPPISPPAPTLGPPPKPTAPPAPRPLTAAPVAASAARKPDAAPSSSRAAQPPVRRIVTAVGGLCVVLLLAVAGWKITHRGPAPAVPPAIDPIASSNTPATPGPPPVVEPPKPPVAAEGRTISVQELAALAGKGPLRDPVYLIGNFMTIDAQGGSAILRPTQESHGELSRQVRVVADYPDGSKLPVENQRLSLTSANHLLVREVRRGADGQINVSARMER